MNSMRTIYHIARADFIERIRRYSFLGMIGLVVWIGYLSASGTIRMRINPDYIGVINSAWVGATMAITVSFILGWVGFYIVKGSINRDYITGVGQIMATTPMSRSIYVFGKWLSNYAVLAITVLVLLLEGIIMNLVANPHGFDPLALAAPLVIIALPSVAVIAALAVLFETVVWLRGGLGNLIYFFAYLGIFFFTADISRVGIPAHVANPFIDFSGWQMIGDSVSQAAHLAFPDMTGPLAGLFTFSFTPLADPKLFIWNGMAWTSQILLSRLIFFMVAGIIVIVSSRLFDRFDPSRVLPSRVKVSLSSIEAARSEIDLPVQQTIHLTEIEHAGKCFHFSGLFIAELKLFLKGQPVWWYAAAVAAIIAQLVTPLEISRMVLIGAWVWPVLMLSKLGCREAYFDTRQIVFSAPKPIIYQLPATWISACVILAAIGSGTLMRYLLAGEVFSMLGWLSGIIFIPTLALFMGVLTGSSKAFEALYVLWMYLLFQKAAPADFMGLTPASPLYIYIPLASLLIGMTFFTRQRQLKGL